MKSSEALRLARKEIKSDTVRFVCWALENVNGQDTKVYKVLSALSPVKPRTLDTWLHTNSKSFRDFCKTADFDQIDAAMLAYRLAWIDWMIEGYEAVGD